MIPVLGATTSYYQNQIDHFINIRYGMNNMNKLNDMNGINGIDGMNCINRINLINAMNVTNVDCMKQLTICDEINTFNTQMFN